MNSSKEITGPYVLHIVGRSGVGKTHLMNQFINANPGSIQLITPISYKQVFDPSCVDWDTHSAIAIDEVLSWHIPSIISGVAQLEFQAIKQNKKLILITQDILDLAMNDIELSNTPLVLKIYGRQKSLGFHYDGNALQLSKDGEVDNANH